MSQYQTPQHTLRGLVEAFPKRLVLPQQQVPVGELIVHNSGPNVLHFNVTADQGIFKEPPYDTLLLTVPSFCSYLNTSIYLQQHQFVDLFYLRNGLLSVGHHNNIFLKDYQSGRHSAEEQKPFPAIQVTNGFPCITCFTVQLSSNFTERQKEGIL